MKRTPEPELEPSPKRLPERDIVRRLKRQFRDFVDLEDEEGYWSWVNEQPGYDASQLARQRAADAWREALSEKRSRHRPR